MTCGPSSEDKVARYQDFRAIGEMRRLTYSVGRTLGHALRRATKFWCYPDSKTCRSRTNQRMILAEFILVISTGLAGFYLLVTVQRILRTPIRRK